MTHKKPDYDDALAEFEKAKAELERLKPSPVKAPPFCSFCGNGVNEYLHLVEGKLTTKICDSCVFESMKLIQEKIDGN